MKYILQKLGEFFMSTIETLCVAASIYMIVILFIVRPTEVNGFSMMPNFHNQDRVYVDEISYRFADPVRGDVISLHAPASAQCSQGLNCDFFKRIIGLPGESIQLVDGSFYINGEKLDEPYLPADTYTKPGPYIEQHTVTLGSTEYFVAGDNRDHSSDSRFWGPIQRKDIIGKAIFRYFPVDRVGILER